MEKSEYVLLNKTNTGISSEFLVAGELSRRGYNVTLTLGNTKAIDLIIEKDGAFVGVQVKGIQRKKSICWNIIVSKIENRGYLYVLVNLNADNLDHPEYFILTEEEVKRNFKSAKSQRDYLDYGMAVKLNIKDTWYKFESSKPTLL
jgi:hypothetical protein